MFFLRSQSSSRNIRRRIGVSWWHRFLRRRKMEEQLEKELSFHIEQYTIELIERGHEPQEARRQALLALGGSDQAKEQCRD
ncbi:MAG: permease prefix domain 1-containing protein, partial [Blastocatellia bacterium]